MAQKLDDTELVTFKELLMANSIQVEDFLCHYSFKMLKIRDDADLVGTVRKYPSAGRAMGRGQRKGHLGARDSSRSNY